MKSTLCYGSLLLSVLALGVDASHAEGGNGTHKNVTEIRVEGKSSVARVWNENGVPHYSISLDGGASYSQAKATHYDLLLRHDRFDPLKTSARASANLGADANNRLYIVQYWTQGLEDYRSSVREAGGEIHFFLANHSNVVEMDATTRQTVAEFAFVRSITPMHPAFKLDPELIDAMQGAATGPVTVDLLTTRRGGQGEAAAFVTSQGGTVDHISDPTYFMTATLPHEALLGLAHLNSVKWINPTSGPGENDMDVARALTGANLVENVGGYVGNDMTIEVMDSGTDLSHGDFRANTLVHTGPGAGSHGTCTAGIVLGTGAGNANARGMCSGARLVVAQYNIGFSGGSRYAHTAELADPAGPYKAVLQSNSWGGNRTLFYNATSADMDTILFDIDHFSILQSQSNSGNPMSRPQAWAKNIIAVGGLNHLGTVTMSDDRWSFGASTGPAADGRIKPDLASFYDRILTTDRPGSAGYAAGNYYSNFGGTSGATPIVAGALGLFYDMWGDGVFGNASGGTIFQDAPNNTLAKAFLITTASQWRFEGKNHDRTRTHQGWGHPNLGNLLTFADRFFWVDETDAVSNLQTRTYTYDTQVGDQQLRATMVYRDPPGTTNSTLHRINNLDLKLIAPSGQIWWGNNGMDRQPFTQLGGGPNNVDTVENVWVRLPEVGTWTIEVIGAEINAETHGETGAVDADFALIVYSGAPAQG